MPMTSRSELGLVIQSITGHCLLMEDKSMLETDIEVECRLCLEEDEDSEHFWQECLVIESE